jgi:hypothetical protein
MHRGGATILLAVLYCFVAIGCGGRLPRARAMNASPDSSRLDIFANEIVVGRDLPFRATSGYRHIDRGFDDIAVFATHSNDLLLEGEPFFAERQDYTIVVLDFVQDLDAILLTDDNSAPMPNNFKVRFVHASPTSDAVDLYITAPDANLTSAQPSFANVVFGGFAGYANLPEGMFQLRVTTTGAKTVIADSGALMFTSGQVRTAVFVNPPGTATEPLVIVLLQDVG